MSENPPERPSWIPSAPLRWREVRSTLSEIVRRYPDDYVYTRPASTDGSASACLYWHAGESQPGCLIGRLLAELGVPPFILAACDSHASGSQIGTLSAFLLKGLFDQETIRTLGVIQSHQDSGTTWQLALQTGNVFHMGLMAGRRMAEREAAGKVDD